MIPVGSESTQIAAGPADGKAPPPWFRAVVWDSLLGALCPLLPVPVVDDLVLRRVRRHLVQRLLRRWGIHPQHRQLLLLARGPRRRGLVRLAFKALIYPLRELLRKVLYVLAIKDAVDTFSLLFHQAYLLHAALARGALGAGPSPSDEQVRAVADAVHGTLAAADTRMVRRLVVGVLRTSRRLLRNTLRWGSRRLLGRDGLAELAEEAVEREALGSPEAEQLLDRLLFVLWGEAAYRQHLEAELARRLEPPAVPRVPL